MLFISGILVLLACFEIYLRCFRYEKLRKRSYPKIYRPHALWGYEYIPGSSSELVAPFRRVPVKINSHGFPGPEFSIAKDQDMFRILVVGYSMLFEENGRIQAVFRDKGFQNVEVINCSLDGASLNWYQYQRIKNDLLQFTPDLVLFETEIPFERKDCSRICYEDFVISYSHETADTMALGMEYVKKIKRRKLETFLFDTFYIVREANRFLVQKYIRYAKPGSSLKKIIERYFLNIYILGFYSRNMVTVGEHRVQKYTIDETLEYLTALASLLHLKGAALVVFDYFSGQRERKRSLCEKCGIRYLNLGISGHHFATALKLKDDSHPSEIGMQRIAVSFFEELISSGWIPKKHLTRSFHQALSSV